MKISLLRTYRSRNGNATFVYKVNASTSDLDSFKEAQGDYYREDTDGSPLWFTTRCVGNTGSLIITTNGNIVPDMSKFDQANSIATQYGGNFGQELAKMSAQAILGVNTPPVVPTEDVKAIDVTEQAQLPAESADKSEDLSDV
jgi:hypothetical protein